MEKQGVAVAIIIDNTDENVQNVVMKDDGTGNSIRIPSMLIGRSDGDKLIEFLTSQPEEVLEKIQIKAEFQMEKPDNRVEYDFWYTSSNDKALDFIRDFGEIDQKFG